MNLSDDLKITLTVSVDTAWLMVAQIEVAVMEINWELRQWRKDLYAKVPQSA